MLAIACSPLDAGQTDVMSDRHDRPMADSMDTECPPPSKNKRKLPSKILSVPPKWGHSDFIISSENVDLTVIVLSLLHSEINCIPLKLRYIDTWIK